MEKDNGLIRLCYHDIFTKHPVVALPLCPALTGDLDEAFVEREVVPDGVLPALAVLTLQQNMASFTPGLLGVKSAMFID